MSLSDSMQSENISTKSLNTALSEMKGLTLGSVEFVMDYLQLRFEGWLFNAYTQPVIITETARLSWGEPGYRDRLCEQIGMVVTDCWSNDTEIAFKFESGIVISVSLKEEDYVGVEAYELNGESGIWIE